MHYAGAMKTAVIPQVRVEPELRADLDSVLLPGETLTEFVEAGGEGRSTGEAASQMRFRVEFTPEADLDRLFDVLLDSAETVEEAIRAPGLVLVIGARHQREEDFH